MREKREIHSAEAADIFKRTAPIGGAYKVAVVYFTALPGRKFRLLGIEHNMSLHGGHAALNGDKALFPGGFVYDHIGYYYHMPGKAGHYKQVTYGEIGIFHLVKIVFEKGGGIGIEKGLLKIQVVYPPGIPRPVIVLSFPARYGIVGAIALHIVLKITYKAVIEGKTKLVILLCGIEPVGIQMYDGIGALLVALGHGTVKHGGMGGVIVGFAVPVKQRLAVCLERKLAQIFRKAALSRFDALPALRYGEARANSASGRVHKTVEGAGRGDGRSGYDAGGRGNIGLFAG